MEMEWKKIARMEYKKIVFHTIPCPASRIEGPILYQKLGKDQKKGLHGSNSRFCPEN